MLETILYILMGAGAAIAVIAAVSYVDDLKAADDYSCRSQDDDTSK
jgi:hypothetical protein